MRRDGCGTYVLVSEVLEQLEFSIGALGEDGRGKRLHNLLYRDGLTSELVFGGAVEGWHGQRRGVRGVGEGPWRGTGVPHETEGAHADRLKVGVAGETGQQCRMRRRTRSMEEYRLVISKVVPKIWALINSAMAAAAAAGLSEERGPEKGERHCARTSGAGGQASAGWRARRRGRQMAREKGKEGGERGVVGAKLVVVGVGLLGRGARREQTVAVLLNRKLHLQTATLRFAGCQIQRCSFACVPPHDSSQCRICRYRADRARARMSAMRFCAPLAARALLSAWPDRLRHDVVG